MKEFDYLKGLYPVVNFTIFGTFDRPEPKDNEKTFKPMVNKLYGKREEDAIAGMKIFIDNLIEKKKIVAIKHYPIVDKEIIDGEDVYAIWFRWLEEDTTTNIEVD